MATIRGHEFVEGHERPAACPIGYRETVLDDHVRRHAADDDGHQLLGVHSPRTEGNGAYVVFRMPPLKLTDHGLTALAVFVEGNAPEDEVLLLLRVCDGG